MLQAGRHGHSRLAFDYGLTSKVLVVFLLSFFPVAVSAVQASRSVDPNVIDLARITGAGPMRMFWKVQVPHALPTLFTGFKVSAALAATAAVVAEFVSSDRGLGYLLVDYANRFDTPGVFAAILVLSFVGLSLRRVACGINQRRRRHGRHHGPDLAPCDAACGL